MRFLMLLSKFGREEPSLYGPLVDFCEEIAHLGHQIHVLTRFRVHKKNISKKSMKNIYVHYVKLPESKLFRIFQFLLFLKESIRLIRTHKIDIVYSHIFGFYGLINSVASKLTNRYCIHWHCGFIRYFLRRMSLKELLTGFIPLRITLRYIDLFITCTKAVQRHYIKSFGISRQKIEILPNGVSLTRFNPYIATDDFKEHLGLKDRRIILYIHHLSPRKGPKYLIKAIPIVKKRVSNCVAILIGDGPQKNELENLIKELNLEEDIFLIGGVPNVDIPKYLAIADILVVPSVMEEFGRVLVEGMACKTPIVATNVGGIPEVAPNEKVALLVPPRNPQKLAEGIIRLLNNKNLSDYLSKNGYERAINLYSQQKVAKRFIEINTKMILRKTQK